MRIVYCAFDRVMRRFSVCCLFLLCLNGCAQVTVISDGAPPSTEYKFGVLAVDLAPSDRNTIVSTSGFGLISSPSGATLGYSSVRVVRMGEECRLVIHTENPRTLAEDGELMALLKSIPGACGG